MSDDPETTFASLLASRLCHDLVNPAGALSTALDVLDNESDADMRQHAESLMREATGKLLAMIQFARIAFGAAGGAEGDLDTESLREVAQGLWVYNKAELDWQLPPAAMPKREARALLNLLLNAERIAPRAGSKITVQAAPGGYAIIAEGRKANVPEDVAGVLQGQATSEEPKLMPARMAQRLLASSGKKVAIEQGEERVVLSLQ